ncbi:MAG: DUF1992 domain-containing protein [Chloroflexales bacterium]|nr:DUF1992 domain-containing protein [Chloroflexales bacterium]
MPPEPNDSAPHEEAAQPPQQRPQKPAPPRGSYEGLIDRRIADAEAAGHFRNLKGAGKPLRLDDDSDVPEELRAGFRLLKNAGYAPAWIELQKTIRDDQAQIAAWLGRTLARWPGLGPAERERLRGEYHQKLRDLARLIENYNLTAPVAAGQLPTLRVKDEQQKLP